MFGVDRALVGHNVPCAVRALVGLAHHAMGLDRRSAHTRGPGIGMCGARGIKVTIERIIKPADDAGDIRHGRDLGDFFGRHNFGLKPHESMLGALGHKHIEPLLCVG